ncbi:MAG: DUF29 domain-containing protein [Thioploca sp.]|nr:DUF29 domain-containing protein [Thioploca sp.]
MKKTTISYEQDFYAWLITNVQLIRQGRFAEMDSENIAEELEAMGRSEKRALLSRLSVLLAHLLKWQFQPEKRSHSWKYTVAEQRRRILRLLEDSPSLCAQLGDKLTDAYDDALLTAAKETHRDQSTFPQICPFSLEQVLNEEFWPE